MKRYVLLLLTTLVLMACEPNSSPSKMADKLLDTASKELGIGKRDMSDFKGLFTDATRRIKSLTASNSTPIDADLEGVEIPAPLSDRPEQLLKRMSYSVSYNKDTKLPNWVAWHLTSDMIVGEAKRPQKAFHEDEDVPLPRATDWDYQRSGYDRGHMCPAADNRYSEDAMYESFLFTNMCPQTHKLNAGDWEELESACRKWAKQYGDIYVVCGPILYRSDHKKIGKNKVVVPEAFFKVVLCLKDSPKAIGFIYKNNDDDKPMGDYVNSVDEVERITGIDFFPSLPDDIENWVEAKTNLGEWAFN